MNSIERYFNLKGDLKKFREEKEINNGELEVILYLGDKNLGPWSIGEAQKEIAEGINRARS
ncbi:MAG: hypothetical protein ABIB79_00660 [archaeon]